MTDDLTSDDQIDDPTDDLPWVIHAVPRGDGYYWLHTHGLSALSLPELEVLDVPSYFVGAGAAMLNGIGEYMCGGENIVAGETMLLGGEPLRFERATDTDPRYIEPGDEASVKATHYGDVMGRLRIVPCITHDKCEACAADAVGEA